jgi:hypothetical protein
MLRHFALAAGSSKFGIRTLEGPECLWGGTRGGGSEEETRQVFGESGRYFED